MEKSGRWIICAILSALILFGLFMAILWKLGLFNFTGTDASAKIVASSLALVGGLFGSLVTVLGIFLKLSIDQRNADLKEQTVKRHVIDSERNAALKEQAEKRLTIDSERNANRRKEAEKRLKMEAAIQAVQLLGSESGKDVPVTQRAGVLFSLTHLGFIELAIAMLDQMLQLDRIDATTAAWIADQALNSNNEKMQLEASTLLIKHYRKLLQENGHCQFPKSIELKWNTELPALARENLANTLLKMIIAKPYSEWDEGVFNTLILILNSIWRTEPERLLKNGVGLCLGQLISVYNQGVELFPPSGKLSLDDLRTELSELYKEPNFQTYDSYKQLQRDASQWSKNNTTISAETSNAK